MPFLFEDGTPPSSSWLDQVQFSMSPCGDLATFLHQNKLVVAKIPSASDSALYEIIHKGFLTNTETDSPTCVLSLSVALQQKSVGTTTSIKTSTWNCIAVGFSSGYLRIYTESGVQLFEQIFHPKPINLLKYCHPKVLQDELLVIYPDILVAVDGFSLYNCLRFCRLQQMRATSVKDQSNNMNISYKKWLLQDQKSTVDVEFYGVRNTTPFEHLFQASLAGGSSHYVGHAGLGPVYNYIAVGKKPFITQYCPSEQAAQPIMSEVVMNVATKLMSYIPGSSWLTGWAQPEPEAQKFEPPIAISKNICIDDPRREITSIRASPKGNLAVLNDTFGRILLLDVNSMLIVNIWKGYREAQCGWIVVPGPREDGVDKPRNTLFLVIYAKKRGILEIWCPYQHYRVAAFNVGKKGILIPSMFNALGEGSLSSPLSIPKWRSSKSCCFLLHENGSMIDIKVPFQNCLGLTYMLSIEDEKILNRISEIMNCGHLLLPEQEAELQELILELQLASNIISILTQLYNSTYYSTTNLIDGINISISKALMLQILNSKELNTHPEFIKLFHISKAFLNISKLYKVMNNHWAKIILPKRDGSSPSLNDVQEAIDSYSALNKDNGHVSINPDFVTFYASFIQVTENKSINDLINLIPNADAGNSTDFVRFLGEMFLSTEGWLVCFDNMVEAGISVDNIFKLFLEACLALNIDAIGSKGYEEQIVLVTRHFLSKYSSHAKLWDTFFDVLRSSTNVCQGFILAIYNQKIAVNELEFTARTLETDKTSDTEELDSDHEDQEWVALSPEHERWYTIRQQLWDILNLQINTNVKCSVNSLLHSNSETVTHIVANYIIDNDLVQNFIDWVERCKNHDTDDDRDEDDDESDEEVFDDALNWLLNIVPWWPYQLHPTTISICLIECIIVQWSTVLETCNPDTDTSIVHLVSATKLVLSLKSTDVQHSLVHVLWETVFASKFKKLYLLVEKIGRQPKDRQCVKDLGINLSTITNFVSIARFLLVNINISKNSTGESFVVKQENVWTSDSRSWLLHKCSAGNYKINPDLVLLHAQLLATLELIVSLNVKNYRPSSLFHPRYHALLFTALTSSATVSFSTSPEIEQIREQMLRVCVKSSVSSDITIQPYHTTWVNLIINLSSLWQCALPIQSYMAVFLYSLGKFDEADEIIITSPQRQSLGLELLNVLIAQLEVLIYFDENSQKLFLPVLSPQISSWLRSKHDPNVAFLDMQTVHRTFCKVLTWVEGDDLLIRNSRELRTTLSTIL